MSPHSPIRPSRWKRLSPANVAAKWCDFGLARLMLNRSMTGDIGTDRYMAPEVKAGAEYDERADVFSFGVLLLELITTNANYRDVAGKRVIQRNGILTKFVYKNRNR